MLTKMRTGHIEQIAKLYINAFPESATSQFGQDFMAILFKKLLLSATTMGFVDLDNGRLTGFIFGTSDTGKLFRETLLKYGIYFVPALVRSFFKNPTVLKKAIDLAIYPSKKKLKKKAELICIAVEKSYKNRRIGSNLFNAFLNAMKKENIKEFSVLTDEDCLEANAFYNKKGFSLKYAFCLCGIKRNLYTYEIN